jgi:hypothetical protein
MVLELSTERVEALLDGAVASAIRNAREAARISASATGLALIGVAVGTYTAKHKGAYPPDLRALVKERMLGRAALVSPLSGKQAYVYIRPPAKLESSKSAETVMAYEDPASHGRKHTDVLFVDRHVWRVAVDQRFHDLVKQAQAASEQAYRRESKGGGT